MAKMTLLHKTLRYFKHFGYYTRKDIMCLKRWFTKKKQKSIEKDEFKVFLNDVMKIEEKSTPCIRFNSDGTWDILKKYSYGTKRYWHIDISTEPKTIDVVSTVKNKQGIYESHNFKLQKPVNEYFSKY